MTFLFLNPTLFYDGTTLVSKVCFIPNIHTTECQCGLFGHPKSCIWSLPITLPAAQWTFTFYRTAWWLYGNARLAHKNKTSVQPKKVTSLAPVKGGAQAFTTLNSNRLGMGEPCCGVVLEETAAGFRSKSPLCHLLELHCLWMLSTKVAPHSEDFRKKADFAAICSETSAVGWMSVRGTH